MSLIAWLPLNTNTIIEQISNKTISAAAGRSLPEYGANGKIGPGYTFSNSGIKVDNIPITDRMSFSLWIKASTPPGETAVPSCHILDLRDSNNGERGYQPIYYHSTDGIQIYSSAGTSQYVICTLDTKWHHLVVTMESNNSLLYIDGQFIGTARHGGVLNSGIAHLNIGCRCNGANPYLGMIQDVRVYNHLLSLKEIKELSKGLLLHYKLCELLDTGTDAALILNEAGYGCNAFTNATHSLQLSDNSIRYNACTYFTNGLNDYISSDDITMPMDVVSMCCWVKGAAVGYNNYHIPLCFKSSSCQNGEAFELSIDSAGKLRGGFVINSSRRCKTTNHTTNILDNKWHMIAITYDGNTIKYYLDGENIDEMKIDGGGKLTANYGHWILGNYYSGGYGNKQLYMSDARIYITALTQSDIKTLYATTQSIDRNGQEYVYDINEYEATTRNTGIERNGVRHINCLSEILELDDGSSWIQITNHNNQSGSNLFPASAKTQFEKTFVYHNDECWSAFPLINANIRPNSNEYEFLSIENQGATDNILIRRWKQSVNPLQATWDQISDYTYIDDENTANPTNRKGLYRYTTGTTEHTKTFLRIGTTDKTNWYGAFGATALASTNNGIPGFVGTTMGLLNLYMRVDPKKLKYKEFKNGIIMPTTINEI